MPQLLRKRKKQPPVMRTRTYRDFTLGWNTAEADPGMDGRYSTRSENMMLHSDNTYGCRWGTQYRGDTALQDTSSGTLAANSFSTAVGSGVVTVQHPDHGLISGHTITFSGCTNLDAIPDTEFNTEHDITRIDDDSYYIVTTTLATAAVVGQPSVAYTHDNRTVNSRVINTEWFQGRFVNVHESGVLTEMSTDGVCRIIFDTLTAGKLVGAPTGWSSGLRFASFATFNGQLLVFNGVDKPLLVDFNNAVPVTYLQDLGTGSNVNVPITRYGVGMNNYVALAGDVENPDHLTLSSSGTSGTYPGDPGPDNDAVMIELGKRVQSKSNVIRGLGRFRDKLVVPFDDVTSIGVLGIYDDTGNHEPNFDDAVDEYGGIAHNAMRSLGDDFLMTDSVGVPSLSRTALNNTIKPDRLSDPIADDLQTALAELSETTLEDRVFAVYNRHEGQYMLFVPNHDELASTTETPCYVLTYNRKRGVKSWHRFRGWNFRCGTRASYDELYFFDGTKLYHYGNEQSAYATDFINDPDLVAPNDGQGITIDWELPWLDLDADSRFKKTRYIKFISKGTASFDVEAYGDFILEDADGNDTPQLTLPMVGGSTQGYGGGEQPFGGGRITNDPRAYAFVMKFLHVKMRIRGTLTEPLRFSALTFYYHIGSMRA